MVANVTAFGVSCTVLSTVTFPYGFTIKEDFPDDVDPIQIGDQTVRVPQMLLDGTLYSYATAKPIEVAISVTPGSRSDSNLGIILAASKVKQQLIPIPDFITMVITYPDGVISTLINGSMVSGPPARSIQSSGRIKTNTYKMVFQDSASVGSSLVGTITSVGSAILRNLG